LAWNSWSCSIGPNWLMAASTGQTKGAAEIGRAPSRSGREEVVEARVALDARVRRFLHVDPVVGDELADDRVREAAQARAGQFARQHGHQLLRQRVLVGDRNRWEQARTSWAKNENSTAALDRRAGNRALRHNSRRP
jgi:hypothetical protein